MAAEFAHLHVHTQYSFLVSTVKVAELGRRVSELGMNAVAITDHANMFGAIKHYKACQAAGVQPILGCELNVARPEGGRGVDHLVVLGRSTEGYGNLTRLVSHGQTRSVTEDAPSVSLDDIAAHSRGLVALTACLGGIAAQRVCEQGPDEGERVLAQLKEIFEPGSLFVELQDHGFAEQPVVNGILAESAHKLDLPLVATNDVHFVARDDAEAQLFLDCVRLNRQYADVRPGHHGSSEMFLKSADEMAQAFSDYPEAIENTLRVAEMCQGLKLELDRPMLPPFPVPEGYDTDGYFEHVAREGLEARFSEFRAVGKKFEEEKYRKSLAHELSVIISMKYPGYFLIVWDFIREAKARGIPVGPGRGSGAGSLVAYSLGITAIDPLDYDLLFERFLNPERVSMPDFDIDFCMARRDEVIGYVADKFGHDSVGQISTFQNLKARSVIKDVARVMGIPANEAQRIASLVPPKGQGQMCTIDEALNVEPKLKNLVESDPQVSELITQARKLEGLTRHAGMHAAGVVISEGPLESHVPCFASDSAIVTQYDKDDVEAAGLVKFDFLGLKTLTVIDICQKLVNARPDRENRPLDVTTIPLDDQATYQLVSSGDTTNVFQLESSGMQQLLRSLKPDTFEDIVAAVALYRPGPLGTGMIDDYVGGKHQRKKPRQLHPLVDGVLAPTHGVPVYQEQVMQIAQRMAGYTLGGADLLRRAMGKKKPAEMARQRKIFVEGAKNNGVSEEQALSIFKEVEGFASYGFNKSHSAAYAMVTYQTAYLKAHYPTEFFCAVMTADRDKIEKVVRTIAEARAWGVSVLPPDIDASETDFTVSYEHPAGGGPARGPGKLRDRYGPQIRFGLGAVRGIGESALAAMFEARAEGGEFRDLFDFAARVDAKKLNKGVLEALVQCGAFDGVLQKIGITRARAFAAVDSVLERARSASRDREAGQTTLFGMFESAAKESNASTTLDEYPDAEPWDRLESLSREKAALGCYVSGHPLLRYGRKVDRLGVTPTDKVGGGEPWSAVTVAGMVEDYQERLFRGGSGGKAGFFEIEDMFGRVKAKVRGDRIETYAHILRSGEPVLMSGKVSYPITDEPEENPEPTILLDEVVPLSDAVRQATKAMSIRFDTDRFGRRELEGLRELIRLHSGPCPVEVVLQLPDGARAMLSVEGARVDPSDAMLGGIERVFGDTVADLV